MTTDASQGGRRFGLASGCAIAMAVSFLGCCCLWSLGGMGRGARSVAPVEHPSPGPPLAARTSAEPTAPLAAEPTSEPDLCPPAAEPLPALTARAVVELNAEVGDDRRVRLVARTNLPDGTTLMFDLRRDGVDGIDGLLGQSRGAVAGSCVAAGALGPTAGLEPGRYTARAIVPAVQPPEVAAILGANLENLRGPDVTRGRFGRSLEAEVTLTVGSEAEARAADGDVERERRELRAELDDLLAAGRAMEPLRREYRNGSLEGARACGDRMLALQARQRAAEERSESLHARSIYAPFGMLWECVSCSEHASEACSMVERERRAYDRGD